MKIAREILRNTKMGIDAIDCVLKYAEDDKFKNEVINQKEVLSDFYSQAQDFLDSHEIKSAEPDKIKTDMLKMGTTMNAAFNHNTAHLASMLIDGYNMGITSIQKTVNELTDEGIQPPEIAKEALKIYDKHIKILRTYL